MINLDNIFHLFNVDDDLDGTDNSTTLMDFKNTPTYWIGMYKKLILNSINFNSKIIKFLTKSDKDLDIKDIEEAGKFVTYNRAWTYIKQINPKNKEHIKGVKIYADDDLKKAINMNIDFLIKTEEYEKCAHLHNIIICFSK